MKFKDYTKLKQLDRIEYLLLRKEKEFSILTFYYMLSIVPIFLLMIILSTVLYLIVD